MNKLMDLITNIKKLKILVLGFYYRNNSGDDAFNYIFSRLFAMIPKFKYQLDIINTDDCQSIPSDINILIIGGGEVLNEYFINKIEKLINMSPDYLGYTIAISCNLGSNDILNSGQLDFIDYFIMRSQSDALKLVQRYGTQYVSYCPDLVLSLGQYISINPTPMRQSNNRIGICLARSIYLNNKSYESYIETIVKFIQYLEQQKYRITLIPFNVSNNFDESDLYLNNDIMKQLGNKSSVKNYSNNQSDIIKLLNLINRQDLIICSRFHAHIFSILCQKPFLSIAHTQKVVSLLNDHHLADLAIYPILDSKQKPINIQLEGLISKFNYVINHYQSVKNKLQYEAKKFNITQSITNVIINRQKRNLIPYYINRQVMLQFISNLIINVKRIYHIETFNEMSISDQLKDQITQYILYQITNDPTPIYYHGFYHKIFTTNFDIFNELVWVYINHHQNNKGFEFKPTMDSSLIKINQLFNLTYIKPHMLEGYHRSGWSYVVNNMSLLHNRNHPLIMETYLDKVFHWSCENYVNLQILPYKNPWVGFIHHTPCIRYSDYNTTRMLQNPYFQQSLANCQGLFVFSQYLKDWLLNQPTTSHLLIENLIHPTETPTKNHLFTYQKYKSNTNKKLVQIGAWLRNTYAIYALKLSNDRIKKCHLKGKDMDNYFKPSNFNFNDYSHSQINSYELTNSMCRDYNSNKYVIYLNEYVNQLNLNNPTQLLIDNDQSVTILSELDNLSYDHLLARNIVFLNLIEASACNVLIECIVRNTPIIINRIPAVIELLGDKYPLYYETLNEIDNLLSDDNIKKATNYLSKIDKKCFTIEYFIDKLNNSVILNQFNMK